MKQPKKLKREYKELVSKKRLNPENWSLLKENPESIEIIHKQTGKRRTISRF